MLAQITVILSFSVEGFQNEGHLVESMAEQDTKNTLLAGIIFDHTDFKSNTQFLDMKVCFLPPNNWHITIAKTTVFINLFFLCFLTQISIRFPGLSRFVDLNSTTLDTQAPNWRTHINFPLYQPFGPRDAHTKFGGQPGNEIIFILSNFC